MLTKKTLLIALLIALSATACNSRSIPSNSSHNSPATQNTPPPTKFINIPKAMNITSSAFLNGGVIPTKYTCDANNILPPLQISGSPKGIKSFAIIVSDPDAPNGTFIHWVIWNIPATTNKIAEGMISKSAVQGLNGAGTTGFIGPCPPSGSHRYFFRVYALDTLLVLAETTTAEQLRTAINGHSLAEGELMGTYQRVKK